MSEGMDLTGRVLVAMPGMGDPRFEHSVIFMCAYSDQGAMGLIVNKPMPDLTLRTLLEQVGVPLGADAREGLVHFGGPVEHGRGFVLHEAGYESAISTLKVGDDFGMTATMDVLEDLALGRGPVEALVALGYAGWGPGQLEAEIADNGWLICEASLGLIFGMPDMDKWEAALASLGIDPLTLSSTAGRA